MEKFSIKRENICFATRFSLVSKNGLFSITAYICDVVNGEIDVKRDTCSFTIAISKDNTDYEELKNAIKNIEEYVKGEYPNIVNFNTSANIEYKKLNSILRKMDYAVYSISNENEHTFNLYKKEVK